MLRRSPLSADQLRWLLIALALVCGALALAVPGWLEVRAGLHVPRWVPPVRFLLPVALLINAVMLALIAVTIRWWWRDWAPSLSATKPARATTWQRWVLGACMIFTVLLNAPRMTSSLWGDEEWTLRHNVVGEYRLSEKTGQLKFFPVSWGMAVWDYRTPNNHGFFSVLAKAAHDLLYRAESKPESLYFKEWVLRVPPLLAALLALWLVFEVMREMGQPSVGLTAAVLLALHPWFVRYSTEARGYGLLFALWPLAVLMLLRGLRTGRRKWWLAFGLCQGLLLWTWMLQLHWVIALNLAALGLIFSRRDDPDRVLLRRWLLGCLVGSMLALPVLLPAMPQLRDWMQSDRALASAPPWDWCWDSAFWLLSGCGWHTPESVSPYCLGRDLDWATHPSNVVLVLAVPALILGVGTVAWLRQSLTKRWLFLAMFLPPVLVVGQSLLTGNVLLSWYASPVLPALCLLLAAGLHQLAACVSTRWGHGVTAVGLICLGSIWAHQCRLLRTHDFEPTRAATQLTRKILNPAFMTDHDPITVQFCVTRPGYDPAALEVLDADGMLALMNQATQQKRALFVHFGDVALARMRHPDLMALLDDPQRFQPPAVFYGMDHAQTRQVWRLRP